MWNILVYHDINGDLEDDTDFLEMYADPSICCPMSSNVMIFFAMLLT